MHSKISTKFLLLLFGFGIVAVFSAGVFCLLAKLDLRIQDIYAQSIPVNNNLSEQEVISGTILEIMKADIPTTKIKIEPTMHLKIPKIKVDSILEQVGLTAHGAVGVPKKPSNAAWFNNGPLPGEIGSAIITGHYGRWKNGALGVFNNLYKLKKGDKVYFEDEKGAKTTFVVREIKKYDAKAVATDVFVASDGKAHLNLITCDGIWSSVFQSYSKRLVVFTDKFVE